MQAVHFGAGNIGRGFIGAQLSRSGYQVCFVDVQAPLVEALRERDSYTVQLLGEEPSAVRVSGVTAFNSQTEPERVAEAIAAADLVTTAVGPHVLKAIASLIAEGIKLRLKRKTPPLNVVACENMLQGSTLLKKEVAAHLSATEQAELADRVGFPDAAVDRIVPVQSGTDLLEVAVEPFYEWVIDRTGIKGEVPPVKGVTYVDDLTPYIERKLYTVNTGHAVCAYTGRILGYETIQQAIKDSRVAEIVSGALEETGALLVAKHDFDKGEHQAYIQRMLDRFRNPHLTDPVARVGRSPLRKLKRTDRLVGPALQLIEEGITPEHLATGIAAAFFFDEPEDPEAVELQQILDRDGVAGALQIVADLPRDSQLTRLVVQRYQRWQEKIEG
ncbi:mannitol-1-phosphate 5-dehydrogenase [Melghirimyces thermohalophilus]|uniref:Mannitol-1-phosphate 5-dehydrogenase n=1 Tax=Melghirimyces thermohalophilus TaxID=1236220 RepID=A0A1G6NLW6_9BACL|nr:mannitol-1-phosphate 5-dehydrogenase [Melghirimyces thermohalophilus]SDC68374.1 mannitol-1-phosphate 5-dehydrogenase [Melghirimyces thermohalophilus]